MSYHKFLTSHPKILKKVQNTTFSNTYKKSNPINMKQIQNNLIDKQNKKISQLKLKLQNIEKQKINSEQSLKYEDSNHQMKKIEEDLIQTKKWQKYLNQQIQNCQKVENETSPQQYFLWKKQLRMESFQNSKNQLEKKVNKDKYEIEKVLKETKKQCQILTDQIQRLNKKIRCKQNNQEQLSHDSIHQSQEQALQEKIKNAMLEQDQLRKAGQIFQENKEILTTQLLTRIEDIDNSLNSNFEHDKVQLMKELNLVVKGTKKNDISPVTKNEESYQISPLIQDYKKQMNQLSQQLSSQLKDMTNDLMKPKEWEKFEWNSIIEKTEAVKTFDQYQEIQKRYLLNQEQFKKYQQQLIEIINQTALFKQKNNELETAIQTMNKVIKK